MVLQTPVEFSGIGRIVIQAHAIPGRPGELVAVVPASVPFAIRIAAPVLPY